MIKFYVTEGGYLVSTGTCPDGMEIFQAGPNQDVFIGTPPGYVPDPNRLPGERWHVQSKTWVDTRSQDQKTSDDYQAVIQARVAEYPPLEDLADAMYWANQGDDTKLKAYYDKVAAVKANNPKPSTTSETP